MGIRLFIILMCLFSVSVSAYGDVIDLPYQYDGTIELYEETNLLSPSVGVILSPKYERRDGIFILPYEFYGESELYDVKFYIDIAKPLDTLWDKNSYRVRYSFSKVTKAHPDVTQHQQIPEPTTCVLLLSSIPILVKRKR